METYFYTRRGGRRTRATVILARMATSRKKVKERLVGGPCDGHLELYGLNKNSHPMDWFNLLVPFTLDDNLYNAREANVKGDKTPKFTVSNWSTYSNLKAIIVNAGEGRQSKSLKANLESLTN